MEGEVVKVVPILEDCQTHDIHETLIMAYASNRSRIEFHTCKQAGVPPSMQSLS